MRLLLIDPYVPTGANLNTSLGWISAAVHRAGHDVFVLDLNSRGFKNYTEILPAFVKDYAPDIVGITSMCTTYTAMLELVDHLSSFFKGHILVGGAQIAFEKENVFKDSARVDFAVVGDGELTVVELLEHLEGNRDLGTIQGLIYRKDGCITANAPRKWWEEDLNSLPFPDYRLFGLRRVPPAYSYRISTSRGCPFGCIFCNPLVMRSKWRGRDFALAIEELKHARTTFGVQSFNISEPTFNITKARVMAFCELLLREEMKMSWTTRSGFRAKPFDDDMARLMVKSGFYDLKIGVETLSPEVFPNVNKGETIDDIANAVHVAKRNGLRVEGSFIVGLPGSTYQTVMDSFRRAQQLGFDKMDWSLLTLYPGTMAQKWVQEHGTEYYDYKQAHQHGGQVGDDGLLRVSFDTPEFPLEDRRKAYEAITWKLKQPDIGRRNWSALKKAFVITWKLTQHDPWSWRENLRYIHHGIRLELNKRKHTLGTYFEFDELKGAQ